MTRKELILDASLDLLTENGLAGTSTKMILEKSGVSNGCLFNLFSTKEEIVKEIFQELKNEHTEMLREASEGTVNLRQFFWKAWHGTVIWAMNNPKKRKFNKMFRESNTISKCFEDNSDIDNAFILERIKTGIEQEEIVNMDLYYILYNFKGNIDGLLKYIEDFPENYSEKLVKETFTYYWRSVVNLG